VEGDIWAAGQVVWGGGVMLEVDLWDTSSVELGGE